SPDRLHAIAAGLGADVPFFLAGGTQLGTGDGSKLQPVDLPDDYAVLLLLPGDASKASTAHVYASFTRERGFAERRAERQAAADAGELAALPPNDLASSPLAQELTEAGAFRADAS